MDTHDLWHWKGTHFMDIGLKHTPYFGKDEFLAVINVPFFPDFKEGILESEFRDYF